MDVVVGQALHGRTPQTLQRLLHIQLGWGFTYTWMLEMVDFGQTFGAGVACGKVDKAVWLGKQAGGWIFGSNGSAVAGANIRFSLKFFDRETG